MFRDAWSQILPALAIAAFCVIFLLALKEAV
jgi:hypothetical protein